MSAYKVTFNGQNESGFVTIGKTVFPSGKAVTVDEGGKVDLGRLRGNPEFTVQAVAAPKAEAKAQSKPSPAVKRRSSQKAK